MTEATLGQTICKPGWTATIRPDLSAMKRAQIAAGVNLRNEDRNPNDYELDHRLPLELGGSPADPGNLSLEFADDPTPGQPFHNRKDDAETPAKHRVCSGEPLRQAQMEFVKRWLAPYPGYT